MSDVDAANPPAAVSHVRVVPGCIICGLCEDTCPEVFDVRPDTSVVRSSAERFYRFERRHGQFARSVSLPPGVNEDDIQANYRDGVLEVRIPKPEEPKPRRIEVGSNKAIEGKSSRK